MTTRSFNDKPRPVYEAGQCDMLADIITFQNEEIAWLEDEVNHMKLVMEAVRGEIEDQGYDAARAMLQYAIERPL